MKRGVSAVTKAEAVWPMLCVLGVPVLLIGLPWIAHALQWPWMLVDWLAGRTMPWFYPHQDSWYFFWLWSGVIAVSAACLRAAWRERDLTPTFGVPLSVLTAVFALMLWGPENPNTQAQREQAAKAREAQAEAAMSARLLDSAAASAGRTARDWQMERKRQLARAHRAADALSDGRLLEFRRELAAMQQAADGYVVDGMRLPAYRSAVRNPMQTLDHDTTDAGRLRALSEKRRLLSQAVAASDAREPRVLIDLVPLEYILASQIAAQSTVGADAAADETGTTAGSGGDVDTLAPLPAPSVQRASELAESLLLIEPTRYAGWRAWALLMDPAGDAARMRGALMAAQLLLREDATADVIAQLKLRTLEFSGDAQRVEALDALDASVAEQARRLQATADWSQERAGAYSLPPPAAAPPPPQ